MICKNCNRENRDNANFCSFCGNSLSKNEDSKINLNKEEFEETEEVIYFDPHDDDFTNSDQDYVQDFEFEVDDNRHYKKYGDKKIIVFIAVILVVLIGAFSISKLELLKSDSEDSSVSSEEKIDSQEDSEIQNNSSKEDVNLQNTDSSDEYLEKQNDLKDTADDDKSSQVGALDNEYLEEQKNLNDDEGNKNNKIGALYIANTECSTILHDSTNKDYGSTRVLDGDFSTVWSEGVSGYGKGEWIRLDFDSIRTVKKIKIVNGLVNKKNGYYNNNRPKSLVLRFSDGRSQTIYLEDDNTGYQVVDIGTVDTSYIKFTIDSVYYGSKYDDTCIADIEILGY